MANARSDAAPPADPDPSNPEFQTVLKALVEVYRPILEEDLKRAGDLAALAQEAEQAEPDCEAEIANADRVFERATRSQSRKSAASRVA